MTQSQSPVVVAVSERLNELIQAAEGLLDAPEPGADGRIEPETLAGVVAVRRAAARLRAARQEVQEPGEPNQRPVGPDGQPIERRQAQARVWGPGWERRREP